MILLVDNYDSFSYNLYQLTGEIEPDIKVIRNDEMTVKEIKLLKGKIIIIRTSIEECYKRVVNRWKEISKNYNEEELTRYQNRKLGMYEWYKSLNKFLENVDNLKVVIK